MSEILGQSGHALPGIQPPLSADVRYSLRIPACVRVTGSSAVASRVRLRKAALAMSAFGWIVLQNSKFAAVRIFGENSKRAEIDDSHILRGATEVAYEFGARR
jgi:hypothetical protein